MAKFKKGDCVDKHEINESGEKYWIKGLKVRTVQERANYPNYYTLWHPKEKYIERSLESGLRKCQRRL